MAMRPLELTEKIAILEALVECHYDVLAASNVLRVTTSTIYRKLRRWGLMPPMFSPTPGGKVLRKDFLDRCAAIHETLVGMRNL
jgi:Bacterial regulatory protein, Fis family